jgi:isopentenyldiphosphate isomerase
MENDEILDLVDENDEVIGQIPRTQTYANDIRNFRVIDAFLRNSEGKLFIPRRTAHKKLFPLALDSSVGGHVSSGESYDETLIREAYEELHLDLRTVSYRRLGTISPFTSDIVGFSTVYEIGSDETPIYNQDDFCEHFWLTPEEIVQKIESGDTAKGNLLTILRHFYL